MPPALTIAAFDFDHTLLKGDSMRAFFRFYLGDWKLLNGAITLSPDIIAFLIGQKGRVETKEHILKYFLGGKSARELSAAGKEFADKVLPRLERKEAMDRLAWHKDQGHHCLMVTASMDIWTQAWAEKHGLQLIATKADYDSEGIFTGKIKGANNWGPGKEINLKEYLEHISVDQMYAYGDSSGDKEMLAMADFPYYRTFSD